MDEIPNSLHLYKVTFCGEAYVLAESKDEARRTYRENANYLNEVVDDVIGIAKYNQVKEV